MNSKSDTPHIYINGRFLTQRMTGVERYAWNICKAMAALGQDFTIVCPHAKILGCYDTHGMNVVKYGFGNSHFWEQCVFPLFFLLKRHFVVFSFTGLGSILVRNKVMTIHDLSFLENPTWFSRSYYYWYKVMTPLAVRTSRHIITVSEFSKSEILRFYPFLNKSDITVAYNAVDEEQFHHLHQSVEAPERFALTVSSLDPRKNFLRLAHAFEGIEGLNLHIVGNANRVFSQQEGMKKLPQNVRMLGRVSDEELIRLYHQADCFIFPSLYEGFGLPPIEAMQCGCPVLASDIPVLREVCGDAAEYFNPLDEEDIRKTIQTFIDNKEEKKPIMRQRGYKNISRFSWLNSAQLLIKLVNNPNT
jgi:glycosyltransferase involved in cell wall biosynthesis